MKHSKIEFGDKLYIVVRNDLLPGQCASQITHCAFQFAKEHPNITMDWMENSNFICLLQVKNEEELAELAKQVFEEKLSYSVFHEPDYDNSLTTIAVEPGQKTRELMKRLKLAFT